MATVTKEEILRGLRLPGWARLTDAARAAIIGELVALPEDVGDDMAPACARIGDVVDALRRAADREGVNADDRVLIADLQAIGHATSIAAFLDLATVYMRLANETIATLQPTGVRCRECGEPIAAGEESESLAEVDGDHESRTVAVHSDCMMLRIIGHEYGVCSCTNYAGAKGVREAGRELRRRREAYGALPAPLPRAIVRRGCVS